MFKKLLNRFNRRFNDTFKKEPEMILGEEIQLSKIDKHMNFLLRDNLGALNKSISTITQEIIHKKEEVIVTLRNLHKSQLMNKNIPEREVAIMDGNRENYIKRISHFVTNIDLPKNYLDTYDYCVQFSQNMEQLNKDIQKNIFVLQHFFGNEVKDTNKALHDLEEMIIEIRVLLEKNGIIYLKEIQKDIKVFVENVVKIKDFKSQINTENSELAAHKEKLDRLNERITTITGGTDYRALELFRQEKSAAEDELKQTLTELGESFSALDTALKKYYYLNPDKKIIKQYLDDLKTAMMNDTDLEIIGILKGIREAIEQNQIDLKDKKKDQCNESIDRLTHEYMKEMQSRILKLEDQKQRSQTKITHNSASLNLSEQQYWINATEDKIKYHNSNIEKLEKNINTVSLDNGAILIKIRTDLEKLMDKNIALIDDLTEGILSDETELKETAE
jgi:hypothetical protein